MRYFLGSVRVRGSVFLPDTKNNLKKYLGIITDVASALIQWLSSFKKAPAVTKIRTIRPIEAQICGYLFQD